MVLAVRLSAAVLAALPIVVILWDAFQTIILSASRSAWET
jgi:hypothetical protein